MSTILKKLDHLGYACQDIHAAITHILQIYPVTSTSKLVFDEYQNASLCYLTCEVGPNIELVEGVAVKDILSKGISLYHTCYEVANIDLAIEELKQQDGILIKPPYPAPLFNNRKVAFIQTNLGLIELLEAEQMPEQTRPTLCISGTFSLDSIKNCLIEALHKVEWELNIDCTDYNQVLQTLYDSSSKFHKNKSGYNIILFRLEDCLRYIKSAELTNDKICNILQQYADEFVLSANNAINAGVPLVVAWCPRTTLLSAKIYDKINIIEREIANNLHSEIIQWHNLLEDVSQEIYDALSDQVASIPYTDNANQELAYKILRKLHLIIRRAYKVIVVDCDNTLWDGVCAEDGTYGVRFNQAHLKLQQKLRDMSANGTLICLASKNLEHDVIEVFANRTEMQLNLADITCSKINWDLKSKNIADIAQALNLNLEDFIFIDDNPVEIAEVTSKHPQILAIQFPTEETDSLAWLSNAWFLDCGANKGFDTERTNFYKSNMQREEIRLSTNSFKEFLENLQIECQISQVNTIDYERIAQLSQRTTQFNFSNKQYTTLTISEQLNNPQMLAYKIHVQDRFGDYGLVGACILAVNQQDVYLDSFYYSCRALGKGVEYKFMQFIAQEALKLGKNKLVVAFRNSAKNQPALNFIQTLPLRTGHQTDGGYIYEFDCCDLIQVNSNIANEDSLTQIPAQVLTSGRRQDNHIFLKALNINSKDQINNLNRIAHISTVSTEETLKSIWQQILNINVQDQDNFFDLGGDSLLAIKALVKIKQLLGIELDLNAFFSNPTLQDLSNYVADNFTAAGTIQPHAIEKSTDQQISFTQEWLWILDQYDQGNSWYYNMPHVMRLRGKINLETLEHAIQAVLTRHTVLLMNLQDSVHGYAINLHTPSNKVLQVLCVNGYTEAQLSNKIDQLYRQPFNLAQDLLLRAYLLQVSPDDQVLLWVFHHIVCDGWSIKLFNAEVSECYNAYLEGRAALLPELHIQFFDYAVWQRNYLVDKFVEQISFWKTLLSSPPIQQMPIDKPRLSRKHEGKFYNFKLNQQVSGNLLSLAREHNTTLFSLLITIYAVQIAKQCQSSEVIILAPISGRRHSDSEELIGCFVNIVAFRFSINLQQSLIANFTVNREMIYRSLENQDIPFNQVLKELGLNKDAVNSSLFQVMFALQNSNFNTVNFNDINASMQQIGYDAARLEFILELEQIDNELIGGIYYNTELFYQPRIRDFCDEFNRLCSFASTEHASLNQFWSNPSNLSILQTAINYPPPTYEDMIVWFEAIAAQYSENIAVADNNTILTYSELNSKSNQLAHYLLAQGISQNDIVAILLPANHFSIISILAVLKIGAVYLPLDIAIPSAYFTRIINDSECKFLICQLEPSIVINHLIVDEQIDSVLQNFASTNPAFVKKDLAYIIYTSGTTGDPKGVKIPHKNIVQLLASTQLQYNFNCSDCTLLFHSIAFDFSVWEIWLALCYGGKLYIPTRTQIKSAQDTIELIIREQVTVLNHTPTAFKQLCIFYDASYKYALASLRMIIFGGESLTPADLISFAELNPHVQFYNMYGITETTVHTTCKLITRADMQSKSNIGKPLPGRAIYILDQELNFVPIGESGEVYVAGHGLAHGYHNLPDLTQKAFLTDVLNPAQLMYKTGDLARIENNELEYLCRIDKQIQLRGFRIELNGIESVLNSHPAVKYSAVSVLNGQLVAYIAARVKTNRLLHSATNDLYILENGLSLYHLNRNETEFLYDEIFSRNQYLTMGIAIEDAKCIIDIGANIGMFCILASQIAPAAEIYAFEPIPEIYQILEKNAQLYSDKIKPLKCGISATNHQQIMNFYPKMSIMSSITNGYNATEDRALIEAHIKSKLADKFELLDSASVTELINSYLVKKSVKCDFVTLDHIIRKHEITKIDLLKIDVEKCELDVLSGITSENWDKIQQCVIEVHDHNNNLQTVLSILENAGLKCKVRQDATLESTNLYIIYASRDLNFLTVNTDTELNLHNNELDHKVLIAALKTHATQSMPEYMCPQYYQIVEQFPLTATGKIDFSKFETAEPNKATTEYAPEFVQISAQPNILIDDIKKVWSKLLNHAEFGIDDNFFDIGGDSLLTVHAYLEMKKLLPTNFRMIDFFTYSTIRKLADRIIAARPREQVEINTPLFKSEQTSEFRDHDIAIIGYSAKFPQADDLDSYWHNINNGKDCITHFSTEELLKLNVDPNYLSDKNFVKSCGKVDNIDKFDYEFFGITPREAAMMDPQHRIFLELCWQALESACYTADKTDQKIGIFAGMSLTHYLDAIYKTYALKHCYGRDLLFEITNHRDYLTNRVSYKLNLGGSSVNINTACSTSLVACIKACQSLIIGENDIALAGAISLILPEHYGYFYQADNVLSPDAVCRPFDRNANGIVIGSGGGVVVLKRAKDALRDGDNIRAIIKGHAINNDGNQKIGFSAPSISGQIACIKAAQQMAGISPHDIGYIEAHGTGTKLGDAIEIAALAEVFKDCTENTCGLGSVKANIGHADCAAGIASLLKVIAMLQQKQIPPTTNLCTPNTEVDWKSTPFYFPSNTIEWTQRMNVGISSFGIGGTNAHLILTSPPSQATTICDQNEYLLILSAQHPDNLMASKADLIRRIKLQPDRLADIAFSLQVGRKDYHYRGAWLVTNKNALLQLELHRLNGIPAASNSAIANAGKSWLNHANIRWQEFHSNCKHRRIDVPSHPLNGKSCWYTDLKFAAEYQDNTTIGKVKGVTSKVLGKIELQSDDDFFDLGGDSLTALSLIEEISRTLKIDLRLDEIYSTRSLNKIAAFIDQKGSGHTAQLRLLKFSQYERNLVIIHAIGGSLYCYNDLVEGLEKANVYGISYEDLTESKFDTIEQLAAAYISLLAAQQLLKEPLYLMGWSFGGTVAFEMARQLKLQNKSITAVYLIDSWAQFAALPNTDESSMRELFMRRISLVHDSAWAKQWNDGIWSRTKMLLNYQPKLCTIPAVLFKATELFPEFATMQDPTNYWRKILQDELTVISLPANHTSIVNKEHSLLISSICNTHFNQTENHNAMVDF